MLWLGIGFAVVAVIWYLTRSTLTRTLPRTMKLPENLAQSIGPIDAEIVESPQGNPFSDQPPRRTP
jgi:hypothetical protein